MMRKTIAIFALTLLALAPANAQWGVRIDSRNTAAQWMAESSDLVFVIRDAHVVAMNRANGTVRWKSSSVAGGAPAYAPGMVAVPTLAGLDVLDPQTGSVQKSLKFSETPTLSGSTSNVVAFLPTAGKLIGIGAGGAIVWQHHYAQLHGYGDRLRHLNDDAVLVQGPEPVLIVDARNGKIAASADGVDDVIGFDGRYLWFNALNGGIKGLDIATNRSVALHNSIVRDAACVEHGVAVAVVDGRLTELDIATQRARALHINGRWVGGPIAGMIYIERGDGLYVQDLRGAKATRLVRLSSEVRLMANDRGYAIAGLRNGTIFVIDGRARRVVEHLQTNCDFYEGFAVRASTLFVHCDDRNGSQLLAFARPT